MILRRKTSLDQLENLFWNKDYSVKEMFYCIQSIESFLTSLDSHFFIRVMSVYYILQLCATRLDRRVTSSSCKLARERHLVLNASRMPSQAAKVTGVGPGKAQHSLLSSASQVPFSLLRPGSPVAAHCPSWQARCPRRST